jgi:flavin reductase (DIM6/NTAB) family NADH-FMN oxidoreductase RutF
MTQSKSTVDASFFRDVLKSYPTGVVAVTTLDASEEPVGMIVGTFTLVSYDPPLVAFLPNIGSSTFPKIKDTGRFCVNILGAHQEDVCRQLAFKDEERFASIAWTKSAYDTPRIAGSVAWIECDIVNMYEAGDHYIVVGDVKEIIGENARPPLLFYRGGFGRFASTSLIAPAEIDILKPLQLVDQGEQQIVGIAEDLSVECLVMTAVGVQLVLLSSATTGTGTEQSQQRLGQRMPFVAPIGAPLIAWGQQEEIERWGMHLSSAVSSDEKRAIVHRVRERGWSIVLHSEEQVRFEKAIADLPLDGASKSQSAELMAASEGLSLEGYEPSEIDANEFYRVRYISAPVFDQEGKAVLLLSLYQLPEWMSGTEIHRYADRLVQGAHAFGMNLPDRTSRTAGN